MILRSLKSQMKFELIRRRLKKPCIPVLLIVGFLMIPMFSASEWVSGGRQPKPVDSIERTRPIDGRDFIPAESFLKNEKGIWYSEEMHPLFPFDELIYSWSVRLPKEEGFRLYLRAGYSNGKWTQWIYGGFWGKVDLIKNRKKPVFEEGKLLMDQLVLNEKAVKYQFKVEDRGERPLRVLPDLHVIYTDNSPDISLRQRFDRMDIKNSFERKILDLPFRTQMDPRWSGKCQSASLAIAMEYFGKKVGIKEIIPYTHDPEYDFPGIWPRTLGAAVEFGFDGYIDRFRTWDRVRATISENKVILCSIKMPEGGDYIDPPYPNMGGHIFALNGVTEDGRVIVTDPVFSEKEKGFRCQWLLQDFEKIWRQAGNVGLVICPPEGAKMKLVKHLPPFPGHQKNQTMKSKVLMVWL